MSAHSKVNAARRNTRRPAKARLGQNFLIDRNAAQHIVDALGDLAHPTVIEIGPGRGALTRALSERAAHLIAVEVDEMLASELRAAYTAQSNVEIVQADFLNIALSELLGGGPSPEQRRAKVIGNIPYYVTSDILLHLIEQHEFIEMIVLMVQKEVADRLVAQPGSRDYGLLTVTAQLFTNVERLFTLPPGAFSPPPQVYSSVLRLRIAPKASTLRVDPQQFLAFCKLAFSQKRKTLLNNLRGRYQADEIRCAISSVHKNESVRAEALSLSELANIFSKLKDESDPHQ